MSKGVQIAVAVVTVFLGTAWLLGSGSSAEGTFQYYQDVSSFLSRKSPSASQTPRGLRVHGFVIPGSIAKDLPAGHVDFAIQDPQAPAATLAVRLLSIDVPDLFKDKAEVVVEGRLENGVFLADRVMAKCPSKYEVAPGAEA